MELQTSNSFCTFILNMHLQYTYLSTYNIYIIEKWVISIPALQHWIVTMRYFMYWAHSPACEQVTSVTERIAVMGTKLKIMHVAMFWYKAL